MDVCEWLDDEAIEKIKEDREPFEAPSTHYTPKPNDLGKLIWLSGKYDNMSIFTISSHFCLFLTFIIKVRGFVRYSFRERLLLLQHVATFSIGPILM